MKVVEMTSEPQVKNLRNMTFNLNQKFGRACKIEIHAWTFSNGREELEFSIYVDNKLRVKCGSWIKLQELYLDILSADIRDYPDESMEKPKIDHEGPNLCSICGRNYVDTQDGFDTCKECLP